MLSYVSKLVNHSTSFSLIVAGQIASDQLFHKRIILAQAATAEFRCSHVLKRDRQTGVELSQKSLASLYTGIDVTRPSPPAPHI